jgi:LytS/YehU family sensor histidine kinase
LMMPLSYQLNNRPWTLCDPGSRTLKLAALAPGNYVLRLGFENVPATIVYFNIAQPWWWQPWAIVCWVLLFLLLVVFIFRWQLRLLARKAQLKTERLELERNLNRSVLTAIRSQMNPHFFFNALNTIQSYIFENDRQNASNYLSKFSRLTRMILEMSDKEQMPLSEEIDALRLYLELEKARFDTDFSFSIELTQGVDQEMLRIPPMLLQPYVENAVKHGLLHKKGPKEVRLQFIRENNLLIVRIDDNGIGRKRSAELNRIRDEHHRSFASEANQKRLELLNKGRSNKLGVEYIDKTDESGNVIGTTVIIIIPIS